VPQRTANIAGNRASIIDFTTAALKRQAGGAATPSGKRGDTIGQSCFGDENFSNRCDIRLIGYGRT
jgi:hypothetical protein